MSFNNSVRKLSLLCCVVFISACASKKVVEVEDPAVIQAKAEARLKAQGDKASFAHAINILQSANNQEEAYLEAKAILDALYKSNPAYLGALINSADISFKLNNIDEAKALYTQVLAQIDKPVSVSTVQPDNLTQTVKPSSNLKRFKVHANNQLGLIARQQGQFDEAEAFYKQALELDPNNATTIKNLAILLDLYRGKLAEALSLYERYQSIVGDTDPKINDWLYDIKNRLPAEEVSDE